MSQFVLDEQLFERAVEKPIARWAVVSNLHHLRPNEVIKDDRVPMILRQLKYPTFITIDMAFWNPRLRHPKYCILCFPFRNDEQELIPDLLRRLLRFPEFRSKAARMGKSVPPATA